MAERRALIEGLDNIKDVDPEAAEDFILNRPPRTSPKTVAPAAKAANQADAELPVQPPARRSGVAAESVRAIPLNRGRPGSGRRPCSHRACGGA